MPPTIFLHYYEGADPAAHLSLVVDVPASHAEKPAIALRPLFASLYEAARGRRPPRAGLLKLYHGKREATGACGDLPRGAHVFLAAPPAAPPRPPPAPAPAPAAVRDPSTVVLYYDSSDDEDAANPFEKRRFGDKVIVDGVLVRADGSRDPGKWLDDRRFCCTVPPGSMNNQVAGVWFGGPRGSF